MRGTYRFARAELTDPVNNFRAPAQCTRSQGVAICGICCAHLQRGGRAKRLMVVRLSLSHLRLTCH